MKLEIDIDEKEFGVDIENKFQDFFKRLQAEIQNRLISNDTLVCGVYELETIEMFLTAFKNATIEKELILDKIRAEIFEEMFSHSGTGEEVIQAYSDGLKKGLEIFNKYNGKK